MRRKAARNELMIRTAVRVGGWWWVVRGRDDVTGGKNELRVETRRVESNVRDVVFAELGRTQLGVLAQASHKRKLGNVRARSSRSREGL